MADSYITNQEWRYATKFFDSNKKIKEEDLEFLKKAIQLSVSSYGLQPYKVIVVESKEIREKLKSVSWEQSQITDASHLMVFANNAHISDIEVDEYINLISHTRSVSVDKLADYANAMKSTVASLDEHSKKQWTAKQSYIAMANVISAAAELKIDACPMEGFMAKEYDKILGLEGTGYTSAVIVTLGYRSEKDTTQSLAKVRKPKEKLFIHL